VRAFADGSQGPHARAVHRGGRYGATQALLVAGNVMHGWAAAALPSTLRGVYPMTTLHIRLVAASRHQLGRRAFDVGPRIGVLVPRGPSVSAPRTTPAA
jgi:hypothetical protein